jgi:hypothetical protein
MMTKEEVNYTRGPVEVRQCKRCWRYTVLFGILKIGKCVLVEGVISPHGSCDKWSKGFKF